MIGQESGHGSVVKNIDPIGSRSYWTLCLSDFDHSPQGLVKPRLDTLEIIVLGLYAAIILMNVLSRPIVLHIFLN